MTRHIAHDGTRTPILWPVRGATRRRGGHDLIGVTTRNALRAAATQPLVDEVARIEDADEALRRVAELSDADLIDVATRSQLQDAILARE